MKYFFFKNTSITNHNKLNEPISFEITRKSVFEPFDFRKWSSGHFNLHGNAGTRTHHLKSPASDQMILFQHPGRMSYLSLKAASEYGRKLLAADHQIRRAAGSSGRITGRARVATGVGVGGAGQSQGHAVVLRRRHRRGIHLHFRSVLVPFHFRFGVSFRNSKTPIDYN